MGIQAFEVFQSMFRVFGSRAHSHSQPHLFLFAMFACVCPPPRLNSCDGEASDDGSMHSRKSHGAIML